MNAFKMCKKKRGGVEGVWLQDENFREGGNKNNGNDNNEEVTCKTCNKTFKHDLFVAMPHISPADCSIVQKLYYFFLFFGVC